jgi:hypothetical protein
MREQNNAEAAVHYMASLKTAASKVSSVAKPPQFGAVAAAQGIMGRIFTSSLGIDNA